MFRLRDYCQELWTNSESTLDSHKTLSDVWLRGALPDCYWTPILPIDPACLVPLSRPLDLRFRNHYLCWELWTDMMVPSFNLPYFISVIPTPSCLPIFSWPAIILDVTSSPPELYSATVWYSDRPGRKVRCQQLDFFSKWDDFKHNWNPRQRRRFWIPGGWYSRLGNRDRSVSESHRLSLYLTLDVLIFKESWSNFVVSGRSSEIERYRNSVRVTLSLVGVDILTLSEFFKVRSKIPIFPLNV